MKEYECLECEEIIEKDDLIRRDGEDTCPKCGSNNVVPVNSFENDEDTDIEE